MPERPFNYRALFAVVYTTSVSSVYFALGVVAHRANGLVWVVFLAAGIFFQLTAMTYVEGASLHQERAGSPVFARYAFNELVSFIAAWALVLDYTILIAVTALTVPSYLAVFWGHLGTGALELVIAFAVILYVALDNLTGVTAGRFRWRIGITAVDLVVQAAVIVLGLALAFHPHHLTQSVNLGTAPSASDLAFALTIAVIAFTGLEAAASVAGEVERDPQADQDPGGLGLGADRARLRRDRDRRRRRSARRPRHHRARHHAHQGADARRCRGAAPDVGGRRPQVRRRDRGCRRPDRRRRRLDAGGLAARIPAGDQPADPERGRATTSTLGHAVRDHRHGRAWPRRRSWCRATSSCSSGSTRSGRCWRSRSRTSR